MPFPTLPYWIQEILQLKHWGISLPPWRQIHPLPCFLHFTGRQGDEKGQETLCYHLPSTAKAVLVIAVLLEEPWPHWSWISAEEITTGPRRTKEYLDFIDVIEQNQTHTAWGGRQRVSYDCSLRVKHMEPVKGSPDMEHLGGNNPRASTYSTAPQPSFLVLTPFSMWNTNTFLSNPQLLFVPFCSIVLLGKQLTHTISCTKKHLRG